MSVRGGSWLDQSIIIILSHLFTLWQTTRTTVGKGGLWAKNTEHLHHCPTDFSLPELLDLIVTVKGHRCLNVWMFKKYFIAMRQSTTTTFTCRTIGSDIPPSAVNILATPVERNMEIIMNISYNFSSKNL